MTQFKQVLQREYASFFDPMQREWYSPTVAFVDPLTSLHGVDQYQSNVDMLASRTMIGKVLFETANIVLHSVEGGAVRGDHEKILIDNVITRWTLRLTVPILPWKPTARFSGISVYKLCAATTNDDSSEQHDNCQVQVTQQTDYWDSINLIEGGNYQKVSLRAAISDFLGQLAPNNFNAPSAGPELPYQLLRRASNYEVRKYPSYTVVETEYTRRDNGFGTLGAFTSNMNPMSPAIMRVYNSTKKTMQWPVTFAAPGQSQPPAPPGMDAARQATPTGCTVRTIPERVVAVLPFSEFSMEPVVRKADLDLREALVRHGISVSDSAVLVFAQYDAIYSVGKRRSEVWIELDNESHPWCNKMT
jgi:hypothetical protein